jgi:hypothetical protein
MKWDNKYGISYLALLKFVYQILFHCKIHSEVACNFFLSSFVVRDLSKYWLLQKLQMDIQFYFMFKEENTLC